MKDFARTEREIAKLRKRNSSKNPVKAKVLEFEAKTKNDTTSAERRNTPKRQVSAAKVRSHSLSPTRSISPDINNQRPNKLFSPTRSNSLGISNERLYQSYSPTRRKSPLSKSERLTQSFSSIQNRSPSIDNDRSRWTSNASSFETKSPADISDVDDSKLMESTPSESAPKVGDLVDVSWFFDNIDLVTTPAVDGLTYNVPQPSEEDEREENGESRILAEPEEQEKRFRNVLNYNIAAWEMDDPPEENKPKKADDFIQRLCDQVRNHVEHLCGMNFIWYQAISYKVQVAGDEGIFYYVKVSVWQNYCVHLRILSQKNQLTAAPELQAILERAEADNGNIEFF